MTDMLERIADWISNGALTRKDRLYKTCAKWWREWWRLALIEAQLHQRAQSRIDAALAEIARQKAPNDTLRRIDKILRDESGAPIDYLTDADRLHAMKDGAA